MKKPLIILGVIAVAIVSILVVSSGGSDNSSGSSVHEANPPVIVGGPNSTVGPVTDEVEESGSGETEHEREERQFAEEYAECPPTDGLGEVCETQMMREAENP